MKKFYKKLFLLFIHLLSISLISCNSNIKDPQIIKNSDQKSLKNVFFEQTKIVKLLNEYLGKNKKTINDYVSYQNNIPEGYIEQLKYALIWFIPLMTIDNHKDSNWGKREALSNFVFNTLSKNWYWYLLNINKMFYAYNPYGKFIQSYDNEENDFKTIKTKFQKLTINIKNYLIQKIIVINLQKHQEDIYKEKYVYYLQYDSNKYIKIYKLINENNTFDFVIWPDLYHIKTNKKIELFLKEFENKFVEKKIETINENLEYNKKENTDGNEENNHVSIQNKFLNDQNNFKNLFKGNYYDILIKSINEINKTNDKIYRFTLRSVYEN